MLNNPQKVLLIEDDVDLSLSIAEFLNGNGYQVIQAVDGFSALEVLRQDHCFDAIILDLLLPVIDGFTFRETQFRERLALEVPVLVLSTMGDLEQVSRRLQAAAALKKPLTASDLLGTLSTMAPRGLASRVDPQIR